MSKEARSGLPFGKNTPIEIINKIGEDGLSGGIEDVCIFPTYSCNLNCYMCHVQHVRDKDNNYISMDDWKAAFTLVNQSKLADDKVVVTNTRLGDYYSEGDETVNYRALDYDNLAEEEGRYWFVVDNNLGDKQPRLLGWVEENGELVENYDVHVRARNFKMRVYLYDPALP